MLILPDLNDDGASDNLAWSRLRTLWTFLLTGLAVALVGLLGWLAFLWAQPTLLVLRANAGGFTLAIAVITLLFLLYPPTD